MNITQFDTSTAWIAAVLEEIKICYIKWKLTQKPDDKFRIALSGGTTPKPIYEHFRTLAINWNDVELFQTDERYTADPTELNQLMILPALTNPVIASLAKLTLFNTELAIKQSIETFAKNIPGTAFDLVILGIGTDGHIASLFSPTDFDNPNAVIATNAPHQYKTTVRLSLGSSVLLIAKNILVIADSTKIEAITHKNISPIQQKILSQSQIMIMKKTSTGEAIR